MISPQTRQLLEELSKMAHGKAVRELLNEEIEKINTVFGVSSFEEVIGRQKAVEALKAIFSFLEKPNPQGSQNKTTYT